MAFLCALGILACARPAQAVTEFCPAHITEMRAPAATSDVIGGSGDVVTDAPSSNYTYTLEAETPRTLVHATMIADTDDGWYGWRAENVPLLKASGQVHVGQSAIAITYASSAALTVVFPKPLVVHHAWVTVARTDGESVMGWDERGDFACEVPDFPDGGAGFAPITRRQAAATPAPAPAASVPPGTAIVVSQPFPIDCDRPFKRATVTRAVPPQYPPGGYGGGVYSTRIEVAVGDNDQLVDAWIYAGGGGSSPFDLAALRAARASSFSSPISYCQRVRGYYLFRADFMPR